MQTYNLLYDEKNVIDTASEELRALHLRVENLRRFENQVVFEYTARSGT